MCHFLLDFSLFLYRRLYFSQLLRVGSPSSQVSIFTFYMVFYKSDPHTSRPHYQLLLTIFFKISLYKFMNVFLLYRDHAFINFLINIHSCPISVILVFCSIIYFYPAQPNNTVVILTAYGFESPVITVL